MATKLGRSPVTKVFDAQDADSTGTSTAIECQRYSDELGAIQVEFSGTPPATGEIVIEGRLGNGLSWCKLADGTTSGFSHDAFDFSNYSASVLSLIATGITITPQMRARIDSTAGGSSVTMDLWIQE